MLINTLETKEYNSYYQLYLDQIPANTSLLEGYQRDFEETSNFSCPYPKTNCYFDTLKTNGVAKKYYSTSLTQSAFLFTGAFELHVEKHKT